MALKPKLGANPLTQGIFSKTEPAQDLQPDEEKKNQETSNIRIKNQDNSSATGAPHDGGLREKVNLRLPTELNDWLDELLKAGKRRHGRKIAKEVWVQVALEFMQAMPVAWKEIQGEEDLRQQLENLVSRIKTQE